MIARTSWRRFASGSLPLPPLFHVGGARTALFTWLFARRHGGTFVLRIEDTDVERPSQESDRRRKWWTASSTGCGGSAWTGTKARWSAGTYGPYFQSERGNRYRAMAARLVAEAVAYYCYCKDEVCRCRELTPEIITNHERDGVPRASRFAQCRPARCASTISSTGRSCSRA